MSFNNSPLETLATFSIVFASGVLFVLGLTRYIKNQEGRTTYLPGIASKASANF